MHIKRFLLAVAAGGLAAAAVISGAGAAPKHAATMPATRGLAFGHEVVVDHQRVSGEPSLSVSRTLDARHHHDIYVSAPYGFSTTASFIWKSEDGGQTFHLIGNED